jgi:hypothetical protein
MLISRPYVIFHINVCYHVIHLVHIITSIRLIGCVCLHLSMLVPHQVIRHKSLLSNVNRHLILRQHHSVLTPIAQALRFRKFFAILNQQSMHLYH